MSRVYEQVLTHHSETSNIFFTTTRKVVLLPTAREGNVFTGVCHSVHNWPHGYSVTAHPCWLLGHYSSLLQRGRYASYWNAFLLIICLFIVALKL